MIDVTVDPDDETPYECFECGQIIVAETPPGRCPDCGGAIRNRQTPIE